MRVLLLASECNPEWPSLPIVGFKLCRALADHVDVTVATHVRNRPNIEKSGFGRAKVVFIDNEYLAAPLYKLTTFLRGGDEGAWTANVAMAYPSQISFEYEVKRHFRRELDSKYFDVVHRVTPMSPTLPSPIARWASVPVVVGPLNGGLRWPPGFTQELHREREWLTYVRGAYRLMPYYQSTYGEASAILAAFDHTLRDLPRSAQDRCFNLPEVGIDPELFAANGKSSEEKRSDDGRVVFLFAGRLVPYKCPDVVIEAMALDESLRKHRLVIVGDGPERPRLEALIAKHRLEGCVELLGRRSQAEVGEWMRRADVFAFPSVRELGAGVVVEAMACGMPCIVVDYGGPGGLIDETRGVRVPLGQKSDIARAFAREMAALAADPERRKRLGAAASAFALECYTWDAKARQIADVYEWVLGRRAEKPRLIANL